MAGEIEETLSINFQADSIHSSSISFGRFENEPLSWERRSSFSHNRYLEEVEKCSKPGSVIEKKAYFEAHFKKKGLLGFNTSVSLSHDGSDLTTSENDGAERIGNQEDFESNEDSHYVQFDKRFQEDFESNEDSHYVQFDQRSQGDFEAIEDHYVQFDQRSSESFEPTVDGHDVQNEQRSLEDFERNEDGHHVQFDEGPVGSDYHGECGVTGYEREDSFTEGPRVSFSSQYMESTMNSYNVLEEGIDNNVTLEETQQPADETSRTLSVNDEVIMKVKTDHDDTVFSDESLRTMNASVTGPVGGVEETALEDLESSSPKQANPEPGVSSVINNVRVSKSSSARSSKGLARNSSRESTRKTNVGKNLSKLVTPTAHLASRTPKEVSRSEGKLTCEIKSEKELRMKKVAECQPSVLKANSRGIQEAKRLNRTVNSTKSEVKSRAAAFNFKSSERAERRKEFYMKLEEKMHAKEAEMNQMQAISQEKTQAEIKKLRKSLNFKATPMPSFYRTALPPQSDGNKAASNNNKSKKVQNKPKCPGSIAGAAFPSNLKTRNRSDQAADESVTASEPHNISASESSLIPSPSTNQSCLPVSKQTAGVLDRRNGQRSLCKSRVSESCKDAIRQSNNGGKQIGETPKNRNEITRKNGMRRIDVRSSSRIDLTVRVAS